MTRRRARHALCAIVVLCLLSCSAPTEKTIPSSPAARKALADSVAPKLAPDERILLRSFIARLDELEARGTQTTPAGLTVAKALDLQRSYQAQVAQAQTSFKEKLAAAKADLRVEVKDLTIIADDTARATSGKSLKFVIQATNRGKRTIDQFAVRAEFRETSGRHQAVIPDLQIRGPLLPGATGRSVGMLPLDAKNQQYILEGKPLQTSAYPVQITYSGGDKLDPGQELKALESLSILKIE